jgi:pimeloyl-ACP methyl ester carboxylesterase
VFWPSTVTHRAKEPWLVKPVSYFKIRNRVDTLAVTGFSELMSEVGSVLQGLERTRSSFVAQRRMHLIGHSFGGRVIIRTFQQLSSQGDLVPLLQAVDSTNVVLINAAAPPSFFEWIGEDVKRAWKLGQPGRFTQATQSVLLNLHSQQDSANKYLFRLASVFNDDPQSCAVGACGMPGYPRICVDHAGRLVPPEPDIQSVRPELNAHNIDTTRIVFDHSDIYKGRMATLIADLFYDQETRRILESPGSAMGDCL